MRAAPAARSTLSTSSLSTRRDGTSAQCRSSRTRSTGCLRAASSTSSRMASHVRNSAPSSSPSIDGRSLPAAAQHLLPGPQRGRTLVLRAPAEQQQAAGPLDGGHGAMGELGAQPRLADARLAGEGGEGDGSGRGRARGPRRGRPAPRRGRRAARPGGRGPVDPGASGRRATGGRCWATAAGRPLGRDPGESRVLAQDGGLQLAQLRSRLQAQLGVEHVPDLAQGVEGVRLPARTG